jgi:hypothetical protein
MQVGGSWLPTIPLRALFISEGKRVEALVTRQMCRCPISNETPQGAALERPHAQSQPLRDPIHGRALQEPQQQSSDGIPRNRCQTVWLYVKEGKLPKPRYLLPNRPVWRFGEVVDQVEKTSSRSRLGRGGSGLRRIRWQVELGGSSKRGDRWPMPTCRLQRPLSTTIWRWTRAMCGI